MKHVFLSYMMSHDNPVYGGIANLKLVQVKSVSRGNSANVFRLTMENHWGTHIDAPNHFFNNGLTVNDYPADFWFFKNPMVIKLDLKPCELLRLSDWTKRIKPYTDIVLFKSGWNKFRGCDNYCRENPGVHSEVGVFLRETYSNIRAIGIDWVSVSSFQDREAGRNAHRSFLDPNGPNNPVPIIEDMDLSPELKGLQEVWIAPLRIEGVDSAPCTVIGVIDA